jgi:hypothetical protein
VVMQSSAIQRMENGDLLFNIVDGVSREAVW